MKKYTQDEALNEIFFENKVPLNSAMRVWKCRYKNGRLGDVAISHILTSYNFVTTQQTKYKKKENEVNYFRHVEKIAYLKIDLSVKEFEEIFKRKQNEISVPKNEDWIEVMTQDNKFIRCICTKKNEWYMDITILRIFIKESFIIHLGDVIDYNKPR